MSTWTLAVAGPTGDLNTARFMPAEFPTVTAGMRALVACAARRFASAECYCGQAPEFCACFVGAQLEMLDILREDLAWMSTPAGIASMEEAGHARYDMPPNPSARTTDRPTWYLVSTE